MRSDGAIIGGIVALIILAAAIVLPIAFGVQYSLGEEERSCTRLYDSAPDRKVERVEDRWVVTTPEETCSFVDSDFSWSPR